MYKLKIFIYSIIDLLTFYKGIKRRINGFIIRFPARWSKYYWDGYESETFNFFKKNVKQGDTVLDIGAHIGLYCVPLSIGVGNMGKVFCFEPTPATYSILLQTIAMNKCANVTPINAAVADETGTLKLNLATKSGKGSNANTLVGIEGFVSSVEITSYSIDDFRKRNDLKIDVLKIDVEGAELLALKGAKNTFEQDRPIGVLALHPSSIKQFGHSLEQIWECIENYKLRIEYNGEVLTKETFCTKTEFFDVNFFSK